PDILLPKQARYQTALYPDTSSLMACYTLPITLEELLMITMLIYFVNIFLIFFHCVQKTSIWISLSIAGQYAYNLALTS
ncbi:MAG: hypothetical protein ACNA7G_11890, partial [Methylobacter sp.]